MTRLECGCEFDVSFLGEPQIIVRWCSMHAQAAETLRQRDAYAGKALIALAGAVPTPEKGYIQDGGPEQMAADIRKLRRQRDSLLEACREMAACFEMVADDLDAKDAEIERLRGKVEKQRDDYCEEHEDKDAELARLRSAISAVLRLTDTETEEFKEATPLGTLSYWRVLEKVRERLLECRTKDNCNPPSEQA